jgi:nucleoside-diphosphate-sugar epimerase
MRVVVTGGGGFIGREAVAVLQGQGADVHLLGRAPAGEGVTPHVIDLLAQDPAPLLHAIAPTHLLHLAWYAEPGKFWQAPENLDWVAASLRLVRGFAAAGGRRAAFAGSCTEYDWHHETLDEATTPIDAATLYGTSKAALFRILVRAAPVLGLSIGWGRIFFLYGPRENAGRLLPDVVDKVAAGQRVATTDGTQRRDFMHVDDVAAALVALLASDVEGAVNIATGISTPVRDLVMMAAAAAGDAGLVDLGARPRQASEPEVMLATISRLRDECGFSPRWSLADGIADAVARRLAARS